MIGTVHQVRPVERICALFIQNWFWRIFISLVINGGVNAAS